MAKRPGDLGIHRAYQEILTPIFDGRIGHRLKVARMRLHLDQVEMSMLLGIAQQQLSKLERGHLRYGHFTLAQLSDATGKFFAYVMTGEGREWIENPEYIQKYWQHRMAQRKPADRTSMDKRIKALVARDVRHQELVNAVQRRREEQLAAEKKAAEEAKGDPASESDKESYVK
jgi:transcriptional regulator with XRE-family HTH domain